jgi:hypothetical protein
MSFKKIEILGVDEGRTYKADSAGCIYNVYFELSLVPPNEWMQIFEEENQISKREKQRQTWFDGRHIVVKCILNEVDDVLRELKHDVAKTNQRYLENLREQSIS